MEENQKLFFRLGGCDSEHPRGTDNSLSFVAFVLFILEQVTARSPTPTFGFLSPTSSEVSDEVSRSFRVDWDLEGFITACVSPSDLVGLPLGVGKKVSKGGKVVERRGRSRKPRRAASTLLPRELQQTDSRSFPILTGSIGMASRALDLMVERVTDPGRKTFGKMLVEHGSSSSLSLFPFPSSFLISSVV